MVYNHIPGTRVSNTLNYVNLNIVSSRKQMCTFFQNCSEISTSVAQTKEYDNSFIHLWYAYTNVCISKLSRMRKRECEGESLKAKDRECKSEYKGESAKADERSLRSSSRPYTVATSHGSALSLL